MKSYIMKTLLATASLRRRHSKIRDREEHMENNVHMVNPYTLFSSKYAIYFLLSLYHGRVVIF